MLMRNASLKQRILCIIHISIFRAFSVEKSGDYTRVNRGTSFNEHLCNVVIINLVLV